MTVTSTDVSDRANFSDFSLTGRVAVVTGGSRGIGAGIVDLLAERGAAVGFAFHQQEAPARALELSIRERGGRALAAQCDVTDDAAVHELFSRLSAALGPADVPVHGSEIARHVHVAGRATARWHA